MLGPNDRFVWENGKCQFMAAHPPGGVILLFGQQSWHRPHAKISRVGIALIATELERVYGCALEVKFTVTGFEYVFKKEPAIVQLNKSQPITLSRGAIRDACDRMRASTPATFDDVVNAHAREGISWMLKSLTGSQYTPSERPEGIVWPTDK